MSGMDMGNAPEVKESPVAPRSGDVSFGICRACGNCISPGDAEDLLAEEKKKNSVFEQKLRDADITISAMDRRIKELMEEER